MAYYPYLTPGSHQLVDVYPRHKAADVYLSFGRSCVLYCCVDVLDRLFEDSNLCLPGVFVLYVSGIGRALLEQWASLTTGQEEEEKRGQGGRVTRRREGWASSSSCVARWVTGGRPPCCQHC